MLGQCWAFSPVEPLMLMCEAQCELTAVKSAGEAAMHKVAIS